MSRLLVFQHVAAEPLGTLDALIRQRGHRMRFVTFEREPDVVPATDRYRGLIVLGGPMNVEDHTDRRHLLTEMHAIESMLAQGKPVLGICLGAQLLAHVLGAPIVRHETPEIGWHPLLLTDAGRDDTVLSHHMDGAPVFQWHRYRFGIPAGAVHLAESPLCGPQAFRHGDNAYGFQFHMEVDQPLIARWLSNRAYLDELAAHGHPVDPTQVMDDTGTHLPSMRTQAEAVFNAFLDLVGRPGRRYTLPSREWV